MLLYRNVKTGRVLPRVVPDDWLEASAGWERIDVPAAEPEAEPAEPADTETPDAGDDDERTDD